MFDDDEDDLFGWLPFFDDDDERKNSNPLKDLLYIAVSLAILLGFYFLFK